MDYKETLNLPRTSFPMKANLINLEERLLREWYETNLYGKIREDRRDSSLYILHDGPPYANGNIHIGHALNKILKDIIIKAKTMEGYNAPFVPGWDCHGLPIEHQVDKILGPKRREMGKIEIRNLCRDYASKFVNIQREEFKRLGVLGEWDRPYLTMSNDYEATIIREFGKFVERGGVYKRKKPVLWCISCVTALAEAEVEYSDEKSPSIFVKFPVKRNGSSIIDERIPSLREKDISIVIWTTTPWTLPANLAVALHPDYEYVALEVSGEIFIVAEELAEPFLKAINKEGHVVAKFKGRNLEGLILSHPFINRESRVVMGEFVTLDQGTGCVHIAPGHGEEDYEIGLKYGLDIYCPVDGVGRFTKDVPFFEGQKVFEANRAIIEKLREKGMLLHEEELIHSYPHCWRCKRPVIFRATEQWFISMEANNLREKSLEAIESVQWIPRWGKERIKGMIASRPDWCISRQRTWGVPIIAFKCKECGYILLRKDLIDHVADLVESRGTDLWFELPAEELLPERIDCPGCGAFAWDKEEDILDVWFDSGVSHVAVLEKREDLAWPADLYLEGSDQHRGWFHSSLLEGVGTGRGVPYKTVLTHGFVVDGSGRKMSKSAGNVISPQDVIKKFGAEILRLWVAAEDYKEDIRISMDILTQLVDAYRRIRNTCRFLLGNLYDFDPTRHMVEDGDLLEIDRWALLRLQQLIQRVERGYKNFEFHIVFHSIHNFCVVDMSALYLDILKDRLYTFHSDSRERRAAQTVLYTILKTLLKLMAPVLTFTAEEAWAHVAKLPGDKESIHLERFPLVEERYLDRDLEERWNRLLKIRGEVAKALEKARKDKLIGSSLEARVDLYARGELYNFLKNLEKDLPMLFIVSSSAVKDGPPPTEAFSSEEIPGLHIMVTLAEGSKCARCWNYSPTVGKDPDYPDICERCAGVLKA